MVPTCIDYSCEGNSIYATNINEAISASGTIASTTGTGDPSPSYTITNGGLIEFGGYVELNSAPYFVGTAVGNLGNLVRQSVLDVVVNSNGINQVTGTYVINATGGGGTGAQIGIIVGGGICGEHFLINPGYGYTSAPTFIMPSGSQQAGSTPCSLTGLLTSKLWTMQVAGGTLTPNTGDGVLASEITASTIDDTPQLHTGIIVNVQNSLPFVVSPGGLADTIIVSGPTTEKVKITAVSTAGSVQTLSMMSMYDHPLGSSMFQGGTNGCLSPDQDGVAPPSGGNKFMCHPVYGATNTTTLIDGDFLGGTGQVVEPPFDTEPFTFSSVNNANAIHIFPATPVLYYTPTGQYVLMQNNMPFTNGATFYAPFYPMMNVAVNKNYVTINTYANGDNNVGYLASLGGNFANGGLSYYWAQNSNSCGGLNGPPNSIYAECPTNPGYLTTAPAAFLASGPFDYILRASNAFQSVIRIDVDPTAGPENYQLIQSGNLAGVIIANNSSGAFVFTEGVNVNGSFSTGGNGSFAGTLVAGNTISSNISIDAPILAVTAGQSTAGVVIQQVTDPTGADAYETFSSCNTSNTCAAPNYGSNASLSAGAVTAATMTVGSQTPSIVNIFPTGTHGSTTYFYEATCNTQNGVTAASAIVNIPNGNAVLGSGNNVEMIVVPIEGCQSVNFYRQQTVGSYTAGLLSGCSGIAPGPPGNYFPTCVDSGLAPIGALPSAQGNSGQFKVDGPGTFGGAVTVAGPTQIKTGTASNTDLAGQLTLSGGTATYNFVNTYTTAPICVATDTTAANAVKPHLVRLC